MKKTLKVRKLIDENGLEVDNYTMVIRLKKIIEELNIKIEEQDGLIMELKRDSKTTKINQMEVQIQHLNDQNKRLLIIIQEIKLKHNNQKLLLMSTNPYGNKSSSSNNNTNYTYQITNNSTKTNIKSIFINDKIKDNNGIRAHTIKKRKKSPVSLLFGGMSAFNLNTASMMLVSNHKKSYPQVQKQKQQQMKLQLKQKKFQKKYYQLLEQTEKLKKELINIKINSNHISKNQIANNNSSYETQQLQQTSSIHRNLKNNNNIISNNFINKSLNSSLHSNYQFTSNNISCQSFIERNIQELQRMTQKKNDLQVENDILKNKLNYNQKRFKQLEKQNQSIKLVLSQLQGDIKRRNLMNSQKRLNKKMPTLFMDLSNNTVQSV